MFKILIADDNHIVRKAIKKIIDWDALNCVCCGEAQNGYEAKRIIERTKPDIVLMDIKMPGIDGLKVIEQLHSKYSQIIFIMITAYDDFEFMRKGVQIGVFDYLLKPVDESELKKVLTKAVCQLADVLEDQKRTEQREIQFEKEREEKVLSDAINGRSSAIELLEKQQKKKLNAHHYSLMLIIPGDNNSITADDFLVIQSQILSEAKKKFSFFSNECWQKDGFVVLVHYVETLFDKDYEILALRIAEFVNQNCKMNGCDNSIMISRHFTDLSELEEMYQQTLLCRDGRFFVENRNIVHYESIKSSSNKSEYKKIKKLELLYDSFRNHWDEIDICMKDFLDEFTTDDIFDISYVRNIMLQAIFMILYIARENGADSIGLLDFNQYSIDIQKLTTLKETREWMLTFAQNIKQNLVPERNMSPQTKAIVDYLHLNYMKSVTLDDVADHIGISSTHVNRILKRETGETVISMLNKIRVNEARRLLKTGQYKVYEIAEMVGYNNYAYFYQIYKKYTGNAPKGDV